MLGLGVSIARGQYTEWLPSDETKLFAWWRFNTGITLNGSNVSDWADSSSNSHDMRQADTGEQPAFSAGVLTFDPSSDTQNLYTSTNIELDGAFVIGFKINPSADNVVIIASNTVNNEMIKLLDNTSSEKIRVRNDSGVIDFTLSSGTILDDAYWVISRDTSDNVTVYKDGSSVAAAQSLGGTFDIDAIGVRNEDTNAYNGTMKEVVIFKDTDDERLEALRLNLQTRLSEL
jgi:hypothetical protein